MAGHTASLPHAQTSGQAVTAHHSLRDAPTTEDTRLKWEEYCRGVLVPPDQDEAMAEKWPWGNDGGDFTAL